MRTFAKLEPVQHTTSNQILARKAQAFCWEPLNVAVELLVSRPPSADEGKVIMHHLFIHIRTRNAELYSIAGADAFIALRAALGTLPLQQRRSCHKLALLVPYRDRPEHLSRFLPLIHAFLTVRCLQCTAFPMSPEPPQMT